MISIVFFFFIISSHVIFTSLATSDEKITINCGSSIKIKHKESGFFLFSDAVQFSQGSQQQVVTFTKDSASGLVYWNIQQGFGNSTTCPTGTPIQCGDTIRLLHTSTKKRLHSHDFRSMITTRNYQVSAFGDTGQYGVTGGDEGDDWVVHCKNRFWLEGESFQLKHKTTGRFLTTAKSRQYDNNNCPMCPIVGQLEASATSDLNHLNYLLVQQGVHVLV